MRGNRGDLGNRTEASFTKIKSVLRGAVLFSAVAAPVALSGCAGMVTANGTGSPAPVAPAITTQPTSQTVRAGQTATFTVAATGTAPLSYQWQKNGTALGGATSSSFTTPATTSSDNGAQFSVVVGNSAGSVTSNTATLTVSAAAAPAVSFSATSLTFASQTVGTSSAAQSLTLTNSGNATLTFSATVSGDFALAGLGTCGSSLATGMSCTISVNFTPTAAGTRTGTLTLTDNASNSPQTIALSGTGTTASSVAPSISTQPANQTVTAGQTATFSVLASGTTPLSYQWQKNASNISGATSSSYTTPATTSADNGEQFTVVVSNSMGSVTSSSATLAVTSLAISMTSLPTGLVGQGYSAQLNATGGATPYSWSVASGALPAGLTLSSSGAISGTPTTAGTSTFTAKVTDVNLLTAQQSFTITINAAGSGVTCAPTGSGVCYYVSPTGSDSNPGTSAAPFLTIQQAANMVNPGDMVIVQDGTYNNPAASGVGSKLITMSRGGTAANHVVFIAEHKWGAKIDGLSNTIAQGFSFAANYIDVKDFECEGFSDSCIDNYNGGSAAGGQYISIVGNNIHDIGRYCTTTTIGRDGIFISNDNVIIEGNQVHDIGRYAPGENGCTNPLYYQANDHGIYVDAAFTSANNLTIKNNIFYRNERGWSIQVYPGSLNNLRILNNTFLCPNPYSVGHIVINVPALSNSVIANNISWQPTTSFLNYNNTSGYTNLSVTNNLTYQGTVGNVAAPSGVSSSGNLDNVDPLLVLAPGCAVDDPSVPNAYLQTGSPAIDAGVTLSDVPMDYAGTPRPQGTRFDIGAFEYIF
jgi:Putative Ig domain/Abnormal spindle-like microcephaly-assoc'd, ASPM-SPD-2-Hydin/Immunoglobulin domain/Immunoglobulin I-set domain/Protein of unknown function (DUF1565)